MSDEEDDDGLFANGWEADGDKADEWWESLRVDEKERVMAWGLVRGMPSVLPWIAGAEPPKEPT